MEILYAILAGGVGVAIVETIKSVIMFKLQKKDTSAKDIAETVKTLAESQKVCMYTTIKHQCKKFCHNGEISAEDMEDLLLMHDIYHKLGGNGYLDAWMERVKELPMR